jgi:hypothetical protein
MAAASTTLSLSPLERLTMSGITDLAALLATLTPSLRDEEYVFCTLANTTLAEQLALKPLCTFQEPEGLTLILEKSVAEAHAMPFETVFRCITLTVHSSLEAVGLTAAVAQRLAEHGISANVIAAYYHDHVFVPADKASRALAALQALQQESSRGSYADFC